MDPMGMDTTDTKFGITSTVGQRTSIGYSGHVTDEHIARREEPQTAGYDSTYCSAAKGRLDWIISSLKDCDA